MSISFELLLANAQDWAHRATLQGWLDSESTRHLNGMDTRTPASLFEAGLHRPLVTAFFGGTGVGKSTLLNRLAGQPIARTGVERPTSREVSLYMHASVELRNLPQDFPVDRARVAHHHDDQRRQILWIDMPDIDSIEQHNRELVLNWLPHIDVLIYVVNPERYRDDKGWRLLQSQGGRHAWLFVMNQWDRGHPAQLDDFQKLLLNTGFQEPIILRTDCRDNIMERKPDDFEQLQNVLRDMADHHIVEQLEQHNQSLRLTELREALQSCMNHMGDTTGYPGLVADWQSLWETTAQEILKGLEWPIQVIAKAFVGHEANPLRGSVDLAPEPARESQSGKPSTSSMLWDDWAQGRVSDILDRLVVNAGHQELAVLPLKRELDKVAEETGRIVLREGQRSLRESMANPGNHMQRMLLKLASLCMVLLPLAAIGWVTFQVVKGYYESARTHLAYLGSDFAIHSGLLIGLSWLLPFFLHRKLIPSAEQTAITGLRRGIEWGLRLTGDNAAEALQRVEYHRQEVLQEGRHITGLISPAEDTGHEVDSTSLLKRVLPLPAGARS